MFGSVVVVPRRFVPESPGLDLETRDSKNINQELSIPFSLLLNQLYAPQIVQVEDAFDGLVGVYNHQ